MVGRRQEAKEAAEGHRAGRPPAARGLLIAAATKLFAAHGFDGTSIQDVGDAVGVTKQAVLHHFATKDVLREAVLGSLLTHWNVTLPRLLVATSASEDRFDAVFGELFRFFAEDADRARVVLRECLDRPLVARRLVRDAIRPWLDAIASFIRRGQEAGRHFADVDADAYVVHVINLVIAATATGPVLSLGLGEGARPRYDRELARMAKASLFAPRNATAKRRSTPAR